MLVFVIILDTHHTQPAHAHTSLISVTRPPFLLQPWLASIFPYRYASIPSSTCFQLPAPSSSTSFASFLLTPPSLFLILHLSSFTTPSSAVSGPGASCGLPYSISHFALPQLPFFSFLPSSRSLSHFYPSPWPPQLTFIHPVNKAADHLDAAGTFCSPPKGKKLFCWCQV